MFIFFISDENWTYLATWYSYFLAKVSISISVQLRERQNPRGGYSVTCRGQITLQECQ
jgi:hypothetical protein